MARKGKAEVLIDIKGDQKDLDRAISKSNAGLRGMGASAKDMGVAFTKMAVAGVAALGAVTAAAWGVTKGFKDYGVELDRVSKATGVTVAMTSQMAYAAEQEHASLDDLLTGWRRLSKAMFDADEGLAESVRSFESVGLSIHDTTGDLKKLEDITLETADIFAQMTDDTKKAALAQELFGRSGMALVPFLELGSKGIKSLMEESKDLGNVWTTEMADGAKIFDDKLTALSYSFNAVKWQIGNALMPEFEKISTWLLDNKDWIVTSFGEIFRFDTSEFGNTVVTELDEIKTWVDENKDLLGQTWDAFITSTDMAISSVKVLFMSLAEAFAFQQFLSSGGGDEEFKQLQKVSASTAKVYQDIGQKQWSQDIVSMFSPTTATDTFGDKSLAGKGLSVAETLSPIPGLAQGARSGLAGARLIQLKLDPAALKDLWTTGTAEVAVANV